MEVIINDKKYRKIERRSLSSSRRMNTILITSMLLSGGAYSFEESGNKRDQKSDQEKIAEYKLILQKKSNLSRSERDSIEYWFKRNFIEVIEEE